MSKYIEAEKLIAALERQNVDKKIIEPIIRIIASLQQDKETLELCNQVWWEERGWIMIPPETSLKGIESLLMQVRKKLQQEQSEVDLEKELENFARQYPMEHSGSYRNLMTLARHFAEWGAIHLNARKEE